MTRLGFLACVIAGCAAGFSSVRADDDSHRKLIVASTLPTKAEIHVVFTEVVKSMEQKDWTGVYAATAEVFRGTQSLGKFRASTLPNFLPGKGKPADWKYAVVEATCAFPKELNGRVYMWTRTKRSDGTSPCLRLGPEVPTVNLSSARTADLPLAELLKEVRSESEAGRYRKYAENILVHSGSGLKWRGSAGCLTIHPDDVDAFFAQIPDRTTGTLELNRGIEDPSTSTSYCY